MLRRVIYVSTLRPQVSHESLGELVEKAAAFNKAHDITGLLAVEDRRVCQVLEGPSAEVEALFRSIQRDPRHFGVTELVNAEIDVITFESWGMIRRPMIDMVMMAFAQ